MQNPTLEHYTNYKAFELEPTVLGLQELQLNSNESSLNAIREKYRQPKVMIGYLIVFLSVIIIWQVCIKKLIIHSS